MDSEDNVTQIGARQPDDDPRPSFYNAYREAEFDCIMARDRQMYTEKKYETLKRKHKQLKLRVDEEKACAEGRSEKCHSKSDVLKKKALRCLLKKGASLPFEKGALLPSAAKAGASLPAVPSPSAAAASSTCRRTVPPKRLPRCAPEADVA